MPPCIETRRSANYLIQTRTKSLELIPFKKVFSSLLDRAVSVGIFSDKEKAIFIPDHPIMPVFHHLPKDHKGLTPLVGRPMVAGIGSLNERLGEWLDRQLQPLVVDLPGYLKDTNQLLRKLNQFQWHESYRWISSDVVSLYSSIPHHLGVRAVATFLQESGKVFFSSSRICSNVFGIFVDPQLLHVWQGLLSPKMRGLDGSQVFFLSRQPIHGLVGEVPHFWTW